MFDDCTITSVADNSALNMKIANAELAPLQRPCIDHRVRVNQPSSIACATAKF
jgi:hypothetical protein